MTTATRTIVRASESNCPKVGEIDALARKLEANQKIQEEYEANGKKLRADILELLLETQIDTVETIYGSCQKVGKPTYKFSDGAVTAALKAVAAADKLLKLAKAKLKAAQDAANINNKYTIVDTKYEFRFVMPK